MKNAQLGVAADVISDVHSSRHGYLTASLEVCKYILLVPGQIVTNIDVDAQTKRQHLYCTAFRGIFSADMWQ